MTHVSFVQGVATLDLGEGLRIETRGFMPGKVVEIEVHSGR